MIETLSASPEWPLTGPRAAFVFLPKRQNESALVAQRYPGGRSEWFYDDKGRPLFLLYEVASP